MHILFLLLAAHALCDYPLQGQFLSDGKNRFRPLPGVPWYQCLFAHAFIHGAAVYLITGSLALGVIELLAHAIIDDLKCAFHFSLNVDQTLHVLCKVAFAAYCIGGA